MTNSRLPHNPDPELKVYCHLSGRLFTVALIPPELSGCRPVPSCVQVGLLPAEKDKTPSEVIMSSINPDIHCCTKCGSSMQKLPETKGQPTLIPQHRGSTDQWPVLTQRATRVEIYECPNCRFVELFAG